MQYTCMQTHTYIHTYIHTYVRTYRYCTQQRHEHINTFKATKDIAAGQEIFIRYGSAEWFISKNLSYTDVDYASTMWRPDLHPLPCRQSFRHSIGEDGQHSFSVLKAIRTGTVLEISLCVEMSVIVVDQFPFLWKFVLTGETESNENTDVPPHAHTPSVVLQMKAKEISENMLNGLFTFISPLTLFQSPNP